MENYNKRRKDLEKALRELHCQGVVTTPLLQTAQGELIIFIGNDVLTSPQILALLDRNELTLSGVRKMIERKLKSRQLAKRKLVRLRDETWRDFCYRGV